MSQNRWDDDDQGEAGPAEDSGSGRIGIAAAPLSQVCCTLFIDTRQDGLILLRVLFVVIRRFAAVRQGRE